MDKSFVSQGGIVSELMPITHSKEEIEKGKMFADMRGLVNVIAEKDDPEKIAAIDQLTDLLKTDVYAKEDLIFYTNFVENLRQIYLNSENAALKKKVEDLAILTSTIQHIRLIVEGESLLNKVSAIIIRNTRAIKIPNGARSIQSHGMIIPFLPDITAADGIVRCEMRFTGKSNLHRFGAVANVTAKMNDLYYVPGTDRDSVGAEKTGEIIRRKEWIQGNDQFGEDDIVGLEVNMTVNPRTLHFFVKGVQQKHFFTGVPEKINFCGYLNSDKSEFYVTLLEKSEIPRAETGRMDDVAHPW
ncbi:MAG: hypothetical protein EZS28_022801 [Streblomastix strix]|uniref:SPRY domain-containing protein n=1 Tax=Streblomastix strix TaxID=222440 RepID=A0A5J4VH29_9EUKA|nr:MAG: hypothetical protein EZS28_022801 [Streblomastix strix]